MDPSRRASVEARILKVRSAIPFGKLSRRKQSELRKQLKELSVRAQASTEPMSEVSIEIAVQRIRESIPFDRLIQSERRRLQRQLNELRKAAALLDEEVRAGGRCSWRISPQQFDVAQKLGVLWFNSISTTVDVMTYVADQIRQ